MCYYARGMAYPKYQNDSTRLEVDMFVKRSNLRPLYIVATNYSGYAVLYSCWNIMYDGSCHPDNAYVYTLNRVKEGHTQAELTEIELTLTRLCIDPALLKPVPQVSNICDFDPYSFPQKTVLPGR